MVQFPGSIWTNYKTNWITNLSSGVIKLFLFLDIASCNIFGDAEIYFWDCIYKASGFTAVEMLGKIYCEDPCT